MKNVGLPLALGEGNWVTFRGSFYVGSSLILHGSTAYFRGAAILQEVQPMSVLDENGGRVKLVLFLA